MSKKEALLYFYKAIEKIPEVFKNNIKAIIEKEFENVFNRELLSFKDVEVKDSYNFYFKIPEEKLLKVFNEKRRFIMNIQQCKTERYEFSIEHTDLFKQHKGSFEINIRINKQDFETLTNSKVLGTDNQEKIFNFIMEFINRNLINNNNLSLDGKVKDPNLFVTMLSEYREKNLENELKNIQNKDFKKSLKKKI